MSDKIVIVTPTLELGGTERVVSVLAEEIVKLNYKLTVISIVGRESFYDFDKDVNTLLSNVDMKGEQFGKLKVLFNLYNNLKEVKPEIVVSFGESFNPLVIIACNLLSIPVYIADRSSPSKRKNIRTKILRSICYPRAQGLIVQTERAKEIVTKSKCNSNIFTLPNPLTAFNDYKKLNKEKIIVTVGRLVDSKNHEELIELFLSANVAGDWRLHIVGDGPNRDKLNKFISNKGCSEQVLLIGSVKNVHYELYKSSIFAFTSLSEGFPNALSEAIAAPLPVIAYDCIAGPAELIKNNKNGFLIPIQNQDEFVRKLKILMENELLRNSFVEGYESHREKYSSKIITEKLLCFLSLK